MASSIEPLWRVLRADLEDAGFSVRGFARLCYETDGRMTWDSWKRTITRALDDDAAKAYAPSRDTAELWARLLRKPADRYVRPQARDTVRAERDRLRDEVAVLRAELERLRARSAPGR